MTNANTDPFIVGLRKVIKTTAPSQEKFAEGVTSKVNLSNVLRGHSGTSLKMREKLARKAGMTVEEVISVGKRSTLPGITSGVDFGADPLNTFGKVAEMSATEILNKVGGLNLDIAEGLVNGYKKGLLQIPAAVRFKGTGAERAGEIIRSIDADITQTLCVDLEKVDASDCCDVVILQASLAI